MGRNAYGGVDELMRRRFASTIFSMYGDAQGQRGRASTVNQVKRTDDVKCN